MIKPDPRTFRVLPWEYKGFEEKTRWHEAVMFGDILTPEGKPYEGDSRYVLKKVLERARTDFGIDDIKVGPELEFFIFPEKNQATPMAVRPSSIERILNKLYMRAAVRDFHND